MSEFAMYEEEVEWVEDLIQTEQIIKNFDDLISFKVFR